MIFIRQCFRRAGILRHDPQLCLHDSFTVRTQHMTYADRLFHQHKTKWSTRFSRKTA